MEIKSTSACEQLACSLKKQNINVYDLAVWADTDKFDQHGIQCDYIYYFKNFGMKMMNGMVQF